MTSRSEQVVKARGGDPEQKQVSLLTQDQQGNTRPRTPGRHRGAHNSGWKSGQPASGRRMKERAQRRPGQTAGARDRCAGQTPSESGRRCPREGGRRATRPRQRAPKHFPRGRLPSFLLPLRLLLLLPRARLRCLRSPLGRALASLVSLWRPRSAQSDGVERKDETTPEPDLAGRYVDVRPLAQTQMKGGSWWHQGDAADAGRRELTSTR